MCLALSEKGENIIARKTVPFGLMVISWFGCAPVLSSSFPLVLYFIPIHLFHSSTSILSTRIADMIFLL